MNRSGFACLAIVVVCMPAFASAANDYLSEELRARVELLKNDVVRSPRASSLVTLRQRSLTLYDWANAMALKGDDLPWRLPQAVTRVSRAASLDEIPGPAQLRRMNQDISGYVEQLRLRDEAPDSLGAVRLLTPGPFEVNTFVAIEAEYTVGTRALGPGTSFYLTTHSGSGIKLQTDNPLGEDYVTLVASKPGVMLEPLNADTTGFRISEGELAPGDRISIRYGDTSGGGPGARMATFSNEFVPMELHLQFEADGPAYVLPRMGLKLQGGPVAGVRAFAPSVVATNEAFEFSVRSEDIFTNRATGPVPGYQVMANGEAIARIAPGGEAILKIVHRFSAPGVYRITVASLDGGIGGIEGVANPILVEDKPANRVFWGETHGHSGMAEGQGTSDEFFKFGLEDARLDFLVHSEHDLWMDDAEWEELRANTLEYSGSDLIAFLGYEWTAPQIYGGHHNVVFRHAADAARIPQQTHPLLSQLYQGLRTRYATTDVLIIPHAHQAGDWRHSDPAMETLVEIQSNHGVFEWFGQKYLSHGHVVGFISASDDHRSHPGYGVTGGKRYGLAAVIAPEKSRDGIFDAMKSRRTYAVSGDRLIMDFSVNDVPMGGRAPASSDRRIAGRVIGTDGVDSITVMRNGEPIWHEDYRSKAGKINRDIEYVEVNFASSSEPLYDQRDNPRSARRWQGSLTVVNGTLIEVHGPGFVDPRSQDVSVDSVDGNRVLFRTVTRGNQSTLMLAISGATKKTEISLALDGAIERPSNGHSRLRELVRIEPWNPTLKLRDIDQVSATAVQDVAGYSDSVSLRRVRREIPMQQSFSFEDVSARDNARDNDYYTMRVEQTNDQLGWSSPVWVGGYPPR